MQFKSCNVKKVVDGSVRGPTEKLNDIEIWDKIDGIAQKYF